MLTWPANALVAVLAWALLLAISVLKPPAGSRPPPKSGDGCGGLQPPHGRVGANCHQSRL